MLLAVVCVFDILRGWQVNMYWHRVCLGVDASRQVFRVPAVLYPPPLSHTQRVHPSPVSLHVCKPVPAPLHACPVPLLLWAFLHLLTHATTTTTSLTVPAELCV
jgi:hypothetical protein